MRQEKAWKLKTEPRQDIQNVKTFAIGLGLETKIRHLETPSLQT